MKKMNLKTIALGLLLSTSLISCGGGNGGGGDTGIAPGSANHNTVIGNEGNTGSATDVATFRQLVQNGNFAKFNFPYSNCYMGQQLQARYTFKKQSCQVNVSEDRFLIFNYTSTSLDCDDISTSTRTEKVDGTLTSTYGVNKVEVINNLLSIIDGATDKRLVSAYRLQALKDGKIYTIDLQYPIATNPISESVQKTNTSWDIEQFSNYSVSCGI